MTEPLSPDTLARLREGLTHAATPLPWSLDPVSDDITGPERQPVTDSDALDVAFCYREDAELAVAAVNALPALLDETDRLRAVEARHEGWISTLEAMRDLCTSTGRDDVSLVEAQQAEIDRLREENHELAALFGSQQERMGEAAELWRKEDPSRFGLTPDLGELLTWLLGQVEAFVLDADLQRESYMAADAEVRRSRARLATLIETIRAEAEDLEVDPTDPNIDRLLRIRAACDQADAS